MSNDLNQSQNYILKIVHPSIPPSFSLSKVFQIWFTLPTTGAPRRCCEVLVSFPYLFISSQHRDGMRFSPVRGFSNGDSEASKDDEWRTRKMSISPSLSRLRLATVRLYLRCGGSKSIFSPTISSPLFLVLRQLRSWRSMVDLALFSVCILVVGCSGSSKRDIEMLRWPDLLQICVFDYVRWFLE